MYNITSIRNAISSFRSTGAQITTIGLIQFFNGAYQIAHGVPVSQSQNAQYGRFLKRNARILGIQKTGTKTIKISGHPTSTAVWS